MSSRMVLAAILCVVAGVAAVMVASRPEGSGLAEGAPARLDALGAELIHLDASAITKRGPPTVWALRLTRPVELVPHHFRSSGLDAPRTVEAWADHLGAPLVFNAGQFDEDLNHLGWLKSGGRWLGEHQHSTWMGLLVSGPLEGAPWSGVVDLERSNPEIAERYRHVVQSMMLVDDDGRMRVRDTDLSACRTVVGQDRDGRVVILVSEGAMTLGDMVRWLPSTGLDLVRAMNLDGGIESQIAIRTAELELVLYGQYGTGTTVFDAGPGQIRYPLPAVIAVHPARSEQ